MEHFCPGNSLLEAGRKGEAHSASSCLSFSHRLKGASLRTSHPHNSLKTHTCHQELLVPVLRRSSWQLFYTLALAGCVKQTDQGAGPSLSFPQGNGFRDCEAISDNKILHCGLSGEQGTGVCIPRSVNYLPVTHQAGLICHAFTSFLLCFFSAPKASCTPSTTSCIHQATQPGVIEVGLLVPLGLVSKKHCLSVKT